MTALTLGAFRPGSNYAILPTRDQSWWKPCLTRAVDSTDTHAWYVAPTSDGSLYCQTCRFGRPRVVIGPKAWIAEIEAALEALDMRRVQELLGVTASAQPDAPIAEPPRFKAKSRADWMEFWKERAAVFEYLGGVPREIAEQQAMDLAGECPA